jgi:hypothetical protein
MGILARFRFVTRPRTRPIAFALVLGLLAAVARPNEGIDPAAPSPSVALAKALRARGLDAAPEDVAWIGGAGGRPSSLRSLRASDMALVRARELDAGDLHDVYLVFARRSPEGVLLEVGDVRDLTHSAGIDESAPTVSGEVAAYTTSLDGVVKAVHVLDLRGHPKESYADFTRLQRLQALGTEWQTTGLAHGVAHDVYALEAEASRATLAWNGATLEADLDGKKLVVDTGSRKAVSGAELVRATLGEKGRPAGLVPWAVDRVRSVPAFGDDKMQIVKAVAYTALDWVKRTKSGVVGDSSGAAEAASDLESLPQGANGPITSTSDPEVGFPPAPMDPLLKPALPNEGVWISLDKDPFITEVPGLPTPFVQSFVRTDPNRTGTRVYVTLWDSRVIGLHMEAGTVEPVSATGEAGPGTIPRTPEVMRTVVAGFNGGFQAQHGEYGMQANGILYLPPKPYGATVMELRDGTTAMGSWPGTADVPDEILSFRQNLTMLVENDKWNPWNRTWWGGTPPGWHDTIHTTRSGLCLTKEGFSGYFYGVDISAEELGRAMLRARCRYGMHLDMNGGHAGFEFYSMAPQASYEPLGRPLQTDWEYEGQVRDLPDFRFRARRMIRSMGHMNFPRYVRRDERDFFYLTARRVLPGPKLGGGGPGEGAWRVKGLPQHGFPYAIATTTVHPESSPQVKLAVLEIDPKAVQQKAAELEDPSTVLVLAPRLQGARDAGARASGELRLVLDHGFFAVVSKDKTAESVLLEGSARPSDATRALVGVRDEDGVLLWVEVGKDEPKRAEAIAAADALLAKAGASKRMHLTNDMAALLGGGLGLDGERDPLPHGPAAVRLVRKPMPGGRAYFESTPIVDVSIWRPLQMQRVRYFGKPKAAASTTPGGPGSATPGTPGTPPPGAPP